LKESFVENGDALVEASQRYLMVSIDGKDNEGLEHAFQPDGSYIPRILMATSSGQLQHELMAPGGGTKYKYFYASAEQARTYITNCSA
jgi:protein-disulfide reductase (glutathione)